MDIYFEQKMNFAKFWITNFRLCFSIVCPRWQTWILVRKDLYIVKMRNRSNSGVRLDYYQRVVTKTILKYQVIFLNFPASSCDLVTYSGWSKIVQQVREAGTLLLWTGKVNKTVQGLIKLGDENVPFCWWPLQLKTSSWSWWWLLNDCPHSIYWFITRTPLPCTRIHDRVPLASRNVYFRVEKGL